MSVNFLEKNRGFTLVEVLIVVIVIGILAGIVVVGYGAVTRNAKETSLKSDLTIGATEIRTEQTHTGLMPADASGLKKKESTTYSAYIHNDARKSFCLAATDESLPGVTMRITEKGEIEKGTCEELPIVAGDTMQNITTANCPTSRTLMVDGRDKKTYWVQRLADNKCWMITNLAYAGGGNNAYGDVKTISDGTSDGSTTYTTAKYYVIPASNATTYPTNPSLTTDGGTSNPQYGYYYNWCAALGAQTGTAACLNSSTPSYNSALSVCRQVGDCHRGVRGEKLQLSLQQLAQQTIPPALIRFGQPSFFNKPVISLMFITLAAMDMFGRVRSRQAHRAICSVSGLRVLIVLVPDLKTLVFLFAVSQCKVT